jgi:hypothetical protein
MSTAGDTTTDIRTFRIDIADEQIDDLRRRIAATRWPSKELVEDRSQGVQLATTKELARYWTEDYDFGRVAARLNALPQFTTEIDGVDVHFIHVRSEHEDALPLIMTPGWPSSGRTPGWWPAGRPATGPGRAPWWASALFRCAGASRRSAPVESRRGKA